MVSGLRPEGRRDAGACARLHNPLSNLKFQICDSLPFQKDSFFFTSSGGTRKPFPDILGRKNISIYSLDMDFITSEMLPS